MRLVIAAVAALLATPVWAEDSPAPITAPFDNDLVVANDRPVVFNRHVTKGQPILTMGARYRRTGRLVNDTTFALFGFGKRTIPAGTPMYFRDAGAIGMGIPISLWCAPAVEIKGRKQPACLLYRDTALAMNRVELIDVADANPWMISSFKLGQVSAPSPEIHEEEVDFPTVIAIEVAIEEQRGDQLRIATTKEAKCEGCSSIKVTQVRAVPIQADGSATVEFGAAGAMTVRPAADGYDVSLEGPLAARAAGG